MAITTVSSDDPNVAIDQFVEQMINARGLKNKLNDYALDEIRADLQQQVSNVVNMALIQSCPEKDAKQILKLLEANKVDEATEIIDNKAVNPTKNITNALVAFRKAYVGA